MLCIGATNSVPSNTFPFASRSASADTAMRQIFSRKSLLLDVVVIACFLYFTVSGLYGGPAALQVAAQAGRSSTAVGDGDLPRSTERERNQHENENPRGTKKKERKKKGELKRQRNSRAPLPAIEPSGGAALRGIDLAEYTPEVSRMEIFIRKQKIESKSWRERRKNSDR